MRTNTKITEYIINKAPFSKDKMGFIKEPFQASGITIKQRLAWRSKPPAVLLPTPPPSLQRSFPTKSTPNIPDKLPYHTSYPLNPWLSPDSSPSHRCVFVIDSFNHSSASPAPTRLWGALGTMCKHLRLGLFVDLRPVPGAGIAFPRAPVQAWMLCACVLSVLRLVYVCIYVLLLWWVRCGVLGMPSVAWSLLTSDTNNMFVCRLEMVKALAVT